MLRTIGVIIAVVVVLGLAMALPAMLDEPVAAAARSGSPGPMEAMGQARTPVWVMLLNPFVGAIGVLVGGRALGARRAPAEVGVPTAREA